MFKSLIIANMIKKTGEKTKLRMQTKQKKLTAIVAAIRIYKQLFTSYDSRMFFIQYFYKQLIQLYENSFILSFDIHKFINKLCI